jgi:hypothetical protein
MIDLYNYPILVVFAAGLAVVLALSEIGWQFGIRAEGRGSSNLTTLESAMLGLLALMIAFTFSMALARFDLRRDAVLNEANAIGTTALRARLLPEPHRTETLKLLQEYVQISARHSAERHISGRANGGCRSLECASGVALATGKSHGRQRQSTDTYRTFYRVT